MVNLLVKAGDKLAARFIPGAKASAGCAYEVISVFGCYCVPSGNNAFAYKYCNYTYIAGNCTSHTVYNAAYGRC